MASYAPLTVANMAALQALPVSPDATVLVVASATLGDNGGGFYRWDPTSSMEPDRFGNAMRSTVTDAGRWLRIFQRSRQLVGGVLVITGGVKSYYATGTTDDQGQVTVRLTEDATASGTALFTEVWLTAGEVQRDASSGLGTMSGNRLTLSADLKTLRYQFTQAQSTKLGNLLTTIAGTVISPVSPIPAGTPVTILVNGV